MQRRIVPVISCLLLFCYILISASVTGVAAPVWMWVLLGALILFTLWSWTRWGQAWVKRLQERKQR